MKRILLLLIIVFMILPFLFKKEIKAFNSSTMNKEVFFQNLKNNFGYNKEGTCGYIALELMLLYYDTFINDDIVEDKYEVNSNLISNSPGSYNDYSDAVNYSGNYDDYILSMKDKSLHALLVYLGKINFQYSYQISFDEQINLLLFYLEEIVGLEEDYHFSIYESEDYPEYSVREWIKNKIQSNNIVLTSISEIEYGHQGTIYELNSHSLISYELYNNEILMHYGYHSGEVNTYRSGMSIESSTGNIVSYNNYNRGAVVKFYCEHIHSDNYNITSDSGHHNSFCPCGYVDNTYHRFDINGNYGTCNKCQYSDLIDFSPVIILDPDLRSLCGTYVTKYDGMCRNNDIVVGFTRILYFDYYSPSVSRLDYYLESSNPDVAQITSFGTIIAISNGTAEIRAIYKNDPRKIGVININVYNDHSMRFYYLDMTTDNRTVFYENGTEVTVLNNPIGLTSIHSGYSRVLGFSSTNSYPTLQDFVFRSSNNNVATVSQYGTVQANYVDIPTEVTITGDYLINPQIQISVNFVILPI